MRLCTKKTPCPLGLKVFPTAMGGKKHLSIFNGRLPANQEKGFTQNLIQQKINYLVESLGW